MTVSRLLRPALAALLVIAAVALSACSGSPSAATPSPKAPASLAKAARPSVQPTLKLVAPTDGASVPAGDVRMAVETTGLKFAMPSNTLVAGEGHVHFTLDDKPAQMSDTPELVMKAVTAGPHKLKAELVQNDTTPFDPPVLEEITFTVQ